MNTKTESFMKHLYGLNVSLLFLMILILIKLEIVKFFNSNILFVIPLSFSVNIFLIGSPICIFGVHRDSYWLVLKAHVHEPIDTNRWYVGLLCEMYHLKFLHTYVRQSD